MSQSYDVAISRRGGFSSVAEASAHRRVVGGLAEKVKQAASVAEQLRNADTAEIATIGSELNTDLAAGKGHVIMLGENADHSTYGAELTYNPADGATRSFTLEQPGSKLTQMGGSFKLEENGITTYFRADDKRGVLTIMDAESDVPRIFGDADPQKLTAGTIQLGSPIIIF